MGGREEEGKGGRKKDMSEKKEKGTYKSFTFQMSMSIPLFDFPLTNYEV